MRISDWSSDVCSSDLRQALEHHDRRVRLHGEARDLAVDHVGGEPVGTGRVLPQVGRDLAPLLRRTARAQREGRRDRAVLVRHHLDRPEHVDQRHEVRSEEHTSELQSLMRISYAVFCLKKKKMQTTTYTSRAIPETGFT